MGTSFAVYGTRLAVWSLVPLATTLEDLPGEDATTFELRHLAGATPKHLREAGPSRILFDHGINAWRSIRLEMITW